MKLVLSPHFDDATLFCAFTLLREQPFVLTVFKSDIQGNTDRRKAEDVAAMTILGAKLFFLDCDDTRPDRQQVESQLRRFVEAAEHVYAPAVEEGGHPHHNMVGEIAGRLFLNVTYYMTYTRAGKSEGVPVPIEQRDWPLKKLKALACYESQIVMANQYEHWLRPQFEYYQA